MMTECEGVQSQISLWLDGLLPGAEAARVEQHLASCAECERDRARLERVLEAIRTMDRVSASEGFTDAVMAALEAEVQPIQRRSVWRWAGGAVGLAAAAGLALILWVEGPRGPEGPGELGVAPPSAEIPEYVLAEIPIPSDPVGILEVDPARPEELVRALAALERLVEARNGTRGSYVMVNY